ncbi:hypothetical protein ACFSNO_29165 [Streptomyces cirratus]
MAAFAVFVLVELRTARPMLDLSLFRAAAAPSSVSWPPRCCCPGRRSRT